MHNSRGHIPSCIKIQFVSHCQRKDLIVSFREIFQRFKHLFFCCFRIKTKECKRKFSSMIIHLRRKEIHFRFSICANSGCMFCSMMNMVGQRTCIVKKLGKHCPPVIFTPESFSNNLCSKKLNHIPEKNSVFPLFICNNVA